MDRHPGLRRAGGAEPVSADTAFWWFSMTKIATATALMQLVESGAVALDAPARDHLADVAGLDPRITVRQLLNHSSGLANPMPMRWIIRFRWVSIGTFQTRVRCSTVSPSSCSKSCRSIPPTQTGRANCAPSHATSAGWRWRIRRSCRCWSPAPCRRRWGLRPLGTLRPLEDVLTLLTRAGFTGVDALHIYRALFGFLYGHVLNELQELVERPEENDEVLRLGLHRLPIDEFPLLREPCPRPGVLQRARRTRTRTRHPAHRTHDRPGHTRQSPCCPVVSRRNGVASFQVLRKIQP